MKAPAVIMLSRLPELHLVAHRRPVPKRPRSLSTSVSKPYYLDREQEKKMQRSWKKQPRRQAKR